MNEPGITAKPISELLQAALQERDCTKQQLANELGVSAGAIGKWIRGEGKMRPGMRERVLAALSPAPAPAKAPGVSVSIEGEGFQLTMKVPHEIAHKLLHVLIEHDAARD